MLQTLRGNPPDWTAYREARAPLARCGSCGSMRTIREFSAKQWDLARSKKRFVHAMHQSRRRPVLQTELETGRAAAILHGLQPI